MKYLFENIENQTAICYNNVITLLCWRHIMNFSENIKQIRKQLFLSQEALAKDLGVSFATVNRWESGKTKPTYKTLKLLDEYCKNNKIEFSISEEN